MNQPSDLVPTMWGTYSPSTRTGTVYAKFKNTGSSSISGNFYFVVVEDSLYYAGPNGDVWHNHVARDYLPTEVGQAVTIAAGDSVIQSQSFSIGASWNENKIDIYAWVQQTAGQKENYQACIRHLGDLGAVPATPTIVKPFHCARLPVVQPTLAFYSTDQNGDQLRYRILWDDDPNFASPDSSTTGFYASGATVNFTLPYALVNGMTYWWKVKCTDPGGSGMWSGYSANQSFSIGTSLPANTCSWYQTTNAQFLANIYDQTVIQGDSIVLVSAGSSITDTVFFETFEAGAVPAGWTVVNGNGDTYQWSVGTTGDIGAYTPPAYGVYYAYYSDDDAGSGVINNNEAILTPAIRVPVGALTLEVLYGYGFQVYETGEKLRFKTRRKTGASWTAWTDLAVYTASGSGTAAHNLTAYLPCDSVQFQWFFSDSTATSHWGYASACDNVVLRYTFSTSGTQGTVTSTTINYHDLSTMYSRPHWGGAVWRKATAGDSIGMKFEYYNGSSWQAIPNSALPGNAAGFFSTIVADTIDLSALDTTTYKTIRMVGLLYKIGTKSPNNPALLDWEAGNFTNYIGIADYNPGTVDAKTSLCISPSIVKNHLDIAYTIADKSDGSRLGIYDAMGRLVKQFGIIATGAQSGRAVWDGCDNTGNELPNGIYFVRLETGDDVAIKKAVILR
ncbi:MAG TPA: FlgD immunoglobulin-like domain containing protein [bacterium]